MSLLKRSVLFGVAMAAAPGAQAHSPNAWSVGLDPWVAVPLAVLLLLFVRGLWCRRGSGRSAGARLWAFGIGWLTLALALLGPMETLAEQGLAPHMVQHMLLIGVAAPLLVLAWPGPTLLRGMPRALRRPVARAIYATRDLWVRAARPATATLLHAVVIWSWHAPPAFDAALRSRALHTLEHITFILSALLFWWAVRRATRAGEAGAASLWILFTMIHMGLLGALLTFAPTPLYAYRGALPFGLTPLEDQQFAGLVMWVPAGAIYLAAGVLVLGYWLAVSPGRARNPIEWG